MKRYLAFLRGINIMGKNKVSMAELKKGFAELGFTDIKTYLNSGNVVFSSDEDNTEMLSRKIAMMIKNNLVLNIAVFVIAQEKLINILDHAPNWWGSDDKEIYDNLIFILPPATFNEIFEKIGEPEKELEKIQEYDSAVFWSFSRKEYQKTNWWSKTASAKVSANLTIRTANTVKKVVKM